MTLKDYAYGYRQLGWNVIPLYDHSKNPSHVKWKEYQERMATDEEIEGWFNDDKVTGLGVITGRLSGIVVVDEDSYKANGMKFEFVSPRIAQTARLGKHHYFRYTEPIKTSGFRQGINIEIKSDGGFIVLPPSRVIVTPQLGETGAGEYKWLKKCKIENLPTVTEAQLLPYRGSLSKTGAVELHELVNAPYGTQHNNLRTIALATFNRFGENEWDIASDFVRHVAQQFDPPHPSQRIEKMIKDVQDFIRINPKDAHQEEAKATKKKYWQPATTNELVQERIRDRQLEKEAPSTGWPELDNLIKGFIPGHIYTLTGDTNVGKTTIAANFTEALREQGKKVLYIALEPDVNLVEYLASVRRHKAFPDITDDELQVIGRGDDYVKIFRGKDVQTVGDLIEAIEKMKEHFDLVIIDHIGYFIQTERDWIQQQSNVVKQLALLAKEQKTAIMMIAHLRKPASKQRKPNDMGNEEKYEWVPTHNDISGSAAFKQDSTEVLIAIRKYKPTDEFNIEFTDKGALLVTKTKVGPNGSVPLVFTERSAVVMSLAQVSQYPEKLKELQEKERFDQQIRIGNADDDEWSDEDSD